MNETLINEKHYPDINTDKLLEKIEKQHPGQLPLLAMAGIFDVNRTCDVRHIEYSSQLEKTRLYHSPSRLIHYIHVVFVRSKPVKQC